jgi:hypothetical protein
MLGACGVRLGSTDADLSVPSAVALADDAFDTWEQLEPVVGLIQVVRLGDQLQPSLIARAA